MGYSTGFTGAFELDKQLSLDDYRFLIEYNKTRHEKEEGQPEDSYWCQWVPTEDGRGIKWDEGEKFYYYVEWLQYLIDRILQPKGYNLTGEVTYQGETASDFGKLIIKDSVVVKTEGFQVGSDIKEVVKKALEFDEPPRFYIEEIAKKLGIEI